MKGKYDFFVYEDGDGDQIVVLAESEERATELFLVLEDNFQLLPDRWVVDSWECWSLFGQVRHGEEARKLCTEGVCIYDREVGWTLLPLDYEAIGINPPSART